MSITVNIDEQLVTDLGREEVEREFEKAIERLERRQLARQMADDLQDIDLTNDPDWQRARDEAWKQYGHRYTPAVNKNEQ